LVNTARVTDTQGQGQEYVPLSMPQPQPWKPRVNRQWLPLLIAAGTLLVIVLIWVIASAGRSEGETRFLAAVQSDGVHLSDDALLQAGHDSCDGKSIDYISDPADRLVITVEALGTIC
jgi:hypothetical protein